MYSYPRLIHFAPPQLPSDPRVNRAVRTTHSSKRCLIFESKVCARRVSGTWPSFLMFSHLPLLPHSVAMPGMVLGWRGGRSLLCGINRRCLASASWSRELTGDVWHCLIVKLALCCLFTRMQARNTEYSCVGRADESIYWSNPKVGVSEKWLIIYCLNLNEQSAAEMN